MENKTIVSILEGQTKILETVGHLSREVGEIKVTVQGTNGEGHSAQIKKLADYVQSHPKECPIKEIKKDRFTKRALLISLIALIVMALQLALIYFS